MKSFVSAVLVLVLLIVGFACYHAYLSNVVEELCMLAERGRIPELAETFAKVKPFFGVFLNHQEVGALEDTVARLRVFYDTDQETARLAEQSLFVSRLQGLYENERLSIGNIL